MYSVVTNSTYDGLCYNAVAVEKLLDGTVDRVHWDEAWYGYARFNPIYRNRYAMRGDPKDHTGPTVFATHSTHKLLAALSQASYLHIRDGKGAIPHARFNESFMMHASTSPLYTIIASNDVTSAMMDGRGGRHADERGHRGSDRVPSGHGEDQRASSQEEGLVLRDVECDGGRRPGQPATRAVPRSAAGSVEDRSGCMGHASGRRVARLRYVCRTTTACSIRSRCRWSRPA